MKGVNTKLNYNQSVTECRDKLVDLCNKWEMDDSDKETMTFEVDDYFMSTIYSVLKILNKPDMREKVKEYISELDAEYDRCIDQAESILAVIGDYDEKPMPSNYIKLVERAKALNEVKNDLQGRLEELI